jgi:hypothetical protein
LRPIGATVRQGMRCRSSGTINVARGVQSPDLGQRAVHAPPRRYYLGTGAPAAAYPIASRQGNRPPVAHAHGRGRPWWFPCQGLSHSSRFEGRFPWLPSRNDTIDCEFSGKGKRTMASARLKPRTNIAHVRAGTNRRSLAAHAVHRSGGLHQRTNDSAERGRGLPVFGTGLLVLAALGLVVITGFMA